MMAVHIAIDNKDRYIKVIMCSIALISYYKKIMENLEAVAGASREIIEFISS